MSAPGPPDPAAPSDAWLSRLLVQPRAWLKPITDKEVPELAERVQTATNAALLVTATVSMAIHSSDALMGRHDAITALRLFLPIALVSLALRAVSAFDTNRRWSGTLAVLLSAVVIADITQTELVYDIARHPMIGYFSLAPVIMTAMVPWRPIHAINSGAIAITATLALGRYLELDAASLQTHVAVAIAISLVAVFGAQLHRQLWREVSQARRRTEIFAEERLDHMARFTGGLAHELKTPLAASLNQLGVARSLVDELKQSIGHPDVNETDMREVATEIDAALVSCREAGNRIAGTIRSMRVHTRQSGTSDTGSFAVGPRIQTVSMMLSSELAKHNVPLEVEIPDQVIHINALHFDQILSNLIRNAAQAISNSDEPGSIYVTGEPREGGFLLVVEDDGPGVPEAYRERIFQPDFSTKTAEGGLGIGLWLSRNLASAHSGGSLRLVDAVGSRSGARFEWWIPEA
jgi:signal transduction histidine kinase